VSGNLMAEQVTSDLGSVFAWGDFTTSKLALTNCIITREDLAGSYVALATNNVAWLPSPSMPVFQQVGGANYYLTNGSPYHNVGTTNIAPDVLADIHTKTTYPPIVYSNITISTDTTLGPTVPRDTNAAPDLGYHYDPLDYAFGGVNLTIDNLTFTPGTAVAWFSTTGISLTSVAGLILQGTATQLCWFVTYDTVQEIANTNWNSAGGMGVATVDWGLGVRAGFSKWSELAGGVDFFDDNNGGYFYALSSEFYGGVYAGPGFSGFIFYNCLFNRVSVDTDFDSDDYVYFQKGPTSLTTLNLKKLLACW